MTKYALFFSLPLLFSFTVAVSNEASYDSITTEDGSEIDIRVFDSNNASKHPLILGFACDAGNGFNEVKTAENLSSDGYNVWMPDILGSLMLPKLKSSVNSIDESVIVDLVHKARQTHDHPIYLIASGSDTSFLLRGLSLLTHNEVAGAILLFPRLMKHSPEPGVEPVYVDAVGKSNVPLLILEGERTPNRWGLNHLKQKLGAGGSPVYSKLIPNTRGFFYQRDNKNTSERLVTDQLPGLIKASIFFMENKKNE